MSSQVSAHRILSGAQPSIGHDDNDEGSAGLQGLWAEVCDEAQLSDVDRTFLRRRQRLNSEAPEGYADGAPKNLCGRGRALMKTGAFVACRRCPALATQSSPTARKEACDDRSIRRSSFRRCMVPMLSLIR